MILCFAFLPSLCVRTHILRIRYRNGIRRGIHIWYCVSPDLCGVATCGHPIRIGEVVVRYIKSMSVASWYQFEFGLAAINLKVLCFRCFSVIREFKRVSLYCALKKFQWFLTRYLAFEVLLYGFGLNIVCNIIIIKCNTYRIRKHIRLRIFSYWFRPIKMNTKRIFAIIKRVNQL